MVYPKCILIKNTPQWCTSYDGVSILACASQLKVRSKNPKDFEYWFCQQTMSKIRDVLLNSPSDGASVLACASHLTVRSKNPENFEH